MNGTLETVGNRPALRFERRLGHSVERVWRAITEPDELRQWCPGVPKWDLQPGAEFTSEEGEGTGRVTEVEPPRLLAYEWGGEQFRYELGPDGDGCIMVFTHVFADRALGAQHAAGWEIYLGRLDAHLAGGFQSEDEAHEAFPALHERYAERFGLDPEVGRRNMGVALAPPVTLEAGPKLRLERRYDHPVERVWRAITDPAELGRWWPEDPMEVTESEPPRLLAGSWYGDDLRFELRPDGDGCMLVFTHAFADRATAARTAAGWDRCFVRFGALLAGEPISESDSLQGWPEVHERYAEHFGVNPELGRKAYAEHPSRQ
ncbi:MAG: SRPBCC family protein [Thermoleophilaceae bacterium]